MNFRRRCFHNHRSQTVGSVTLVLSVQLLFLKEKFDLGRIWYTKVTFVSKHGEYSHHKLTLWNDTATWTFRFFSEHLNMCASRGDVWARSLIEFTYSCTLYSTVFLPMCHSITKHMSLCTVLSHIQDSFFSVPLSSGCSFLWRMSIVQSVCAIRHELR